MADPIITQEVFFEMLEKLPDGTFKIKFPKVKSKSGVTFDEHLADNTSHLRMTSGSYIGDNTTNRLIDTGVTPKFILLLADSYANKALACGFITTGYTVSLAGYYSNSIRIQGGTKFNTYAGSSFYYNVQGIQYFWYAWY